MNGRILVSKPLYVALAQRKEERKAQLAAQHMQRIAGMRMQQVLKLVVGIFTDETAVPAVGWLPPRLCFKKI